MSLYKMIVGYRLYKKPMTNGWQFDRANANWARYVKWPRVGQVVR